MTLPVGQISFSQVNAELLNSPTAQLNIGSAPVRSLAGVPTGQIAMSNLQGKSNAQFVAATGGTVTTVGNYKIHVFSSSGTFTVTNAGNPSGSAVVDYWVLAGGGSGGGRGARGGGGGGAGGWRESVPSPAAWTASPKAAAGGGLTVAVQSYPITVGAGGAASGFETDGNQGSPSIFSTITSAGGGKGGSGAGVGSNGAPGGSGGGNAGYDNQPVINAGNSPPVAPPQGNPSGQADTSHVGTHGGGGGGAISAGSNQNGGNGTSTSITNSPLTKAGGGGGGGNPGGPGPNVAGTGGTGGGTPGVPSPNPPAPNGPSAAANSGSGSGGVGSAYSGAGGSGYVVLRYKFQ